MRLLKNLKNAYKKENDTEIFQVQLLENKQPFSIPEGSIVKVVIANTESMLINKEATIVDSENGIVEFDINEKIGNGYFDCEVVVLNGDDYQTFPERHYLSIMISQSLENRPESGLTSEIVEIINKRLSDLETKKADANDINNKLAMKSDVNHSHEIDDVSGLQLSLDNKINVEDIQFLTEEEVNNIWNNTK